MFPYREGTKQTILETNYVKVIVFKELFLFSF